jgi:hypothetical protein
VVGLALIFEERFNRLPLYLPPIIRNRLK